MSASFATVCCRWSTVLLWCLAWGCGLGPCPAEEPALSDRSTLQGENHRSPLLSVDWSDSATPTERLKVPKGFRVDLIYDVPRSSQGSWVCLTVDGRGRIIASDQDGYLYRIEPPPVHAAQQPARVTRLDVRLGMAQGLTFLDNALYVVVNGQGIDHRGSGLYRLSDRDGDDQFETVDQLRTFDGDGEHGPHAVIPSPDRKSLYVLAGNHTKLTEIDRSKVPLHWGEDQLLPRLWDAMGHAVGILAPGGWICRTDLDGQQWELVSVGFRNPYDIAFDARGELFTYDADMEWDIGAPWYRPTRICHVTSGSEFGWRSGSGKWPPYFPDSLPPVIELGPGSPTGITFAYETNFPPPYCDLLFACDWSFGRMYAVRLTPRGGSYAGEVQEFLTGAPLPLTDVVVNPHDGALYFSIGGRKTQSGLYRIVYTGRDPHRRSFRSLGTDTELTPESALRRKLEQWHGSSDRAAVKACWPHLGHPDRWVRFAARIGVESQPVSEWRDRALRETDPRAAIEAVTALARCETSPSPDLAEAMLATLLRVDDTQLDRMQRLAWLRAGELVLIRMSYQPDAKSHPWTSRLRQWCTLPDADVRLRAAYLLAFLQDPGMIDPMLEQLESGPTQERQIAYAYGLRPLMAVASPAQQERYFSWFPRCTWMHGGASLRGFLDLIRQDAATHLPAERKAELATLIASPIADDSTPPARNGPLVRHYSSDDVLRILQAPHETLLGEPISFDEARTAFAKASCFKCHRIDYEGGSTGPDLTTAARRFSRNYLVESIVEPEREISDRFRTYRFEMIDGQVITGRIANMSRSDVRVVTNMLRPGDFEKLDRDAIREISPSPTSEMPSGLLDSLTPREIVALFDYLECQGDPDLFRTRGLPSNRAEGVSR